jgi:hypothetical protein
MDMQVLVVEDLREDAGLSVMCAKKGDGRHIQTAEEPESSDERVSVVADPPE